MRRPLWYLRWSWSPLRHPICLVGYHSPSRTLGSTCCCSFHLVLLHLRRWFWILGTHYCSFCSPQASQWPRIASVRSVRRPLRCWCGRLQLWPQVLCLSKWSRMHSQGGKWRSGRSKGTWLWWVSAIDTYNGWLLIWTTYYIMHSEPSRKERLHQIKSLLQVWVSIVDLSVPVEHSNSQTCGD